MVGHAPSQPGPSGPQKRVAWVAQADVSPSEIARREGKKQIAREAIRMNNERKRAQTARATEIEAEKMRNLQIAEEMMKPPDL